MALAESVTDSFGAVLAAIPELLTTAIGLAIIAVTGIATVAHMVNSADDVEEQKPIVEGVTDGATADSEPDDDESGSKYFPEDTTRKDYEDVT